MHAEIIPRQEAIAFLAHPQPAWLDKIWTGATLGRLKVKVPRNRRGPGPSADLINYGAYLNGKVSASSTRRLVAVLRVAPCPYGNAPAKAALGADLAPHTAYLSRLGAAGISHTDLVAFLQSALARLRSDLRERGKDYRYLLSLDDPTARLIEMPGGFPFDKLRAGLSGGNGVTGKVYVEAGALDAGATRACEPTRYVDNQGRLRSVYQSGKNVAAKAAADGLRLIREGPKRRFVFILAPAGSVEYATWRQALPVWVREPTWGDNGLGWVQPRLLIRRTHLGVQAAGVIDDLVELAIHCFGFLLHPGETLTREQFADRIQAVYDAQNPRTAAILGALRRPLPCPA